MKLLLTEAGIAGSKNPHRFRHSYATMVVRQTANLEVGRELLGHSDIKTTSHYVHTNSQDRHDAADKVDLVPHSEVTTPPAGAPVSPCLVVATSDRRTDPGTARSVRERRHASGKIGLGRRQALEPCAA